MSINISDEKRILTEAEFDMVARTHHPEINELDRAQLAEAAKRLRTYRDKARDVANRQRREMRGKAEARGARPASDNSGTQRKRRVFASALKRVNRELARFAAAERKPNQADFARRALELKRAARVQQRYAVTRTRREGPVAIPSTRSTVKSDPREIGRVSQFVKNAQARRDG